MPDLVGDDKFEIVRGDIVRGEANKLDTFRIGVEGEAEKFSRRNEVSDIEAGRFIPLFLL